PPPMEWRCASLHVALPISLGEVGKHRVAGVAEKGHVPAAPPAEGVLVVQRPCHDLLLGAGEQPSQSGAPPVVLTSHLLGRDQRPDRKSTRLNSSHVSSSYA